MLAHNKLKANKLDESGVYELKHLPCNVYIGQLGRAIKRVLKIMSV